MVTFRVHRNISVTARVITGLASVASLAFFIFILFKVLTGDFRAGQTTYSVLPVVAVSYAILWNATALVTIFHFKFGRYFYPVGDTIAFVALAALGGIGVGHDIATYLSNNGNTYYSGYGDFAWLRQTIIGASLALCAVVFQFFLVVWSFITPASQITTTAPPPYANADYVEEKMEDEWQSISPVVDNKNAVTASGNTV